MKVIIGVDGSAGGCSAAAWACQLLSPQHDEVVLYNSPPQLQSRGTSQLDAPTLQRAREAVAAAIFERVANSLDPAWKTRTRTVCGEQKPAHGLLVAAEEHHVDMIVVGARGLGPIERTLVGSVSRAVAHQAQVPVLVARPRTNEPPHPLRVLMACDGSPGSQLAGHLLARIQWPDDAVCRTATVLESRIVGELPAWLEQQARDSSTDLLAKAWVEQHDHERQQHLDAQQQFCRDHLPAAFHRHPPLLREGHPADQLLRIIAEQRIDLVVCGARNQALWRQFLLGSTSQHLLNHAPCSVLIARQHETP